MERKDKGRNLPKTTDALLRHRAAIDDKLLSKDGELEPAVFRSVHARCPEPDTIRVKKRIDDPTWYDHILTYQNYYFDRLKLRCPTHGVSSDSWVDYRIQPLT